ATDYLEAKIYSDNGVLIATKLERDDPPRNHPAEVEGTPTLIDDNTISVFGVVVDLSGVNYQFSSSLVEIDGDYIDGVFVASSIESEDDQDSDHHDHD
ncbi:MAG: hypothetical protein ABW100_13485, partial [Candidatus Thiodiazotropha sp. 6PLUC3]